MKKVTHRMFPFNSYYGVRDIIYLNKNSINKYNWNYDIEFKSIYFNENLFPYRL